MCVVFAGLSASAQEKGDIAIGLNVGIAPCIDKPSGLSSFGIQTKVQYNFSDFTRVEADFDYWSTERNQITFITTFNIHYVCRINKFAIYPLVGIGYANIPGEYYLKDNDSGVNISRKGKFVFNMGAGFQFALTSNVFISLDARYQAIRGLSRIPTTLGFGYKF